MARASQAARSTIRCSHYAEVVLVRRVERNIEQAAQSSRGAEDTIVSLAANSPVLHRSHEVLQDDVRAVQRCPSGVTRRGRRPLSRQARAGRFGSGFECSYSHRGPRRMLAGATDARLLVANTPITADETHRVRKTSVHLPCAARPQETTNSTFRSSASHVMRSHPGHKPRSIATQERARAQPPSIGRVARPSAPRRSRRRRRAQGTSTLRADRVGSAGSR